MCWKCVDYSRWDWFGDVLGVAGGTGLEMCWFTFGGTRLEKCWGKQVGLGWRFVGDSV